MSSVLTRLLATLTMTIWLLSGCGGNGGTNTNGEDNLVPADGRGPVDDAGPLPDLEPETSPPADLEPELPGPFPLPALTEPVPFRVGVAGGLMPAPLGTPICGFMPPDKPGSPYSDQFPGSLMAYLHPTVRVVAMEGGLSRLLFVRLDLIGLPTHFVARLEHDLTELTGYDWSGKVIMNASHPHSSTGRWGQGVIFGIMIDSFFPELYEQMMTGIADLARQAILDMEPGAMGYGVVETDKLHNDRRCENPELRDDRVHLFRFDRADGSHKALVMVHSVHGTIFDVKLQNYSRDAVGGIEEKVKAAFDSPVEVLFLQAGTGDMAPTSPAIEGEADYPDIGHDYNRIEKIGEMAAEVVIPAFEQIKTSSDVPLSSRSHYAPLSRQILGYADGEFPFEGGGAYCGSTADSDCWTGEPTPIPDLDKMCLDIKMMAMGLGYGEEQAPDRTLLTVALLGDVMVVTFPGEPLTNLLLKVEEELRALFPEQEKIVVLGYSQDYIGYSTQEWDFYQGGYEASGAMWGPKQGDYLAARAVEVGAALLESAAAAPFADPGPYPLLKLDIPPFEAEFSAVVGTVVKQPPATVTAPATVRFEFTGGSPWLLLPQVYLEREAGDGFEPVLRQNGSPVDSYGWEFFTRVAPEPDYVSSPDIKTRTYVWQIDLPTGRPVASAGFPLKGKYRLRAVGSYRSTGGDGIKPYEVISDTFLVN